MYFSPKVKSQLNSDLIESLGSQYKTINAGGCGIVAYHLAKELCAIGLDAKIAWLSCSTDSTIEDKSFSNLSSLTQLNEEFDIRCAHCLVLVDGQVPPDRPGSGVREGLSRREFLLPRCGESSCAFGWP